MKLFKHYYNVVKVFLRGGSYFIKYQIFTKMLEGALLLPFFYWAVQRLLIFGGFKVISNGDILSFIRTPYGAGILLLGFVFLSLAILIEIAGTITISSLVIHKGPEVSFYEIIKTNIKKMPKFLDIGTVILLLYLAVFIPLTGAGITLNFFQNIRIPKFISSEIFANPKYLALYVLMLLLMVGFSIFLLFTFHFLVIGDERPFQSIKYSFRMVKENFSDLMKYFIGTALINIFLISVIVVCWLFFILYIIENVQIQGAMGRIALIVLWFIQILGIQFASILFFPFEVHHLTMLFYQFAERTPGFYHLAEKRAKLITKTREHFVDHLFDRKRMIIIVGVLGIFLAAIPIGIFFRELFYPQAAVKVIGHRGGVIGIPENSISAITEAVKQGADAVEIDVQRTKDGEYILNHDNTFSRMAGVRKTSQEMTVKEIKELDLGYQYPKFKGERVATLEEAIDSVKGKAGLYIELKGSTADKQMVDDVVKMVKEKGVKDSIVLMTLDYNLIKYIEEKYSEIESGFVYFFAVGDPGNFAADQLLLEEDAATRDALDKILGAGKKPIVWTVNDEESMDKFLGEEVHGIVSDNVESLEGRIQAINEKSDQDIILNLFLKGGFTLPFLNLRL